MTIMKESTLDPEKYPALGLQDEELIKAGIHKAETTSIDSGTSANTDSDDDIVVVDDSSFNPTRTLYVLRHNLFSKEINVIDLTGQTGTPYTGGAITDEFRDAARGLTEDKARTAKPVYQLKRKHWYTAKNCMLTSPSSSTPSQELANWTHCALSFGTATLDFPAASPHSSHSFTMAPLKFFRRTNTFVVDSVVYTYKCDSKMKANRITLVKQIGERQVVVARYAQRWGSWITGGVLLVDGKEVDEVVAVLATVVMLRRMQQRAAERTRYGGGGGGGGGGGE